MKPIYIAISVLILMTCALAECDARADTPKYLGVPDELKSSIIRNEGDMRAGVPVPYFRVKKISANVRADFTYISVWNGKYTVVYEFAARLVMSHGQGHARTCPTKAPIFNEALLVCLTEKQALAFQFHGDKHPCGPYSFYFSRDVGVTKAWTRIDGTCKPDWSAQ